MVGVVLVAQSEVCCLYQVEVLVNIVQQVLARCLALQGNVIVTTNHMSTRVLYTSQALVGCGVSRGDLSAAAVYWMVWIPRHPATSPL